MAAKLHRCCTIAFSNICNGRFFSGQPSYVTALSVRSRWLQWAGTHVTRASREHLEWLNCERFNMGILGMCGNQEYTLPTTQSYMNVIQQWRVWDNRQANCWLNVLSVVEPLMIDRADIMKTTYVGGENPLQNRKWHIQTGTQREKVRRNRTDNEKVRWNRTDNEKVR